jgi:argininosuccinate lyase
MSKINKKENMKLWSKQATSLQAAVEKFTVGNDLTFDLQLAKYDVIGNMAQAAMLRKIGVLTQVEHDELQTALKSIQIKIESGDFAIEEGVEDIHSQIEWMLTQEAGDAGKKIHTGRSRNDQVATDIKLFLRAELLDVLKLSKDIFDVFIALSNQHKSVLMPGYTHLQIAMPSSFGLWFASFAESMIDDVLLLQAAYKVTNKNPLGSGAGYGSSFPIDRSHTTQTLNFDMLNYNSIYAQTTRGKTEKVVAMALSSIAATLNKLASDICLFGNQNHGFINFPAETTTGSSIMPHKKNLDVFELIRAKSNQILALPNALTMMLTNMPTGYHRDVQLTKELLFPQINSLKSCLDILLLILPQIGVKENILEDEKYLYLFSVEAVNELVKDGIPFRDAYKTVGEEIEKGTFKYDTSNALNHTHEGSIGNLCNEKIVEEMEKLVNSF